MHEIVSMVIGEKWCLARLSLCCQQITLFALFLIFSTDNYLFTICMYFNKWSCNFVGKMSFKFIWCILYLEVYLFAIKIESNQ